MPLEQVGVDECCQRLDRVTRWLDSSEFAKHVTSLMDSFHVPGLSLAIVSVSQIHTKAFGQASIDPPIPCTSDTIFDVASVSKALTAIAVASIIEEDQYPHEIRWDTPLSTLLPDDFVMMTPEATNSITVEDVLSHRTGLPG